MILLVLGSFFIGMFFYCYCDVSNEDAENSFITIYHLDEMSIKEISIVLTYYTVTTLSTIGFGDYYPHSSKERIFISVTILFGVAIFSSIMRFFRSILNQFKILDNDFNDEEGLSDFMSLLRNFNMD